jgi:hypothetical protein
MDLKYVFKTNPLFFIEHERYVRLCTSLPVRILWRFPKTLHVCARIGDEIPKTDFRSIARPH